MIDPIAAMSELDGYARELDGLSKSLATTEDRLREATDLYEEFMAAYEEGLWDRHVKFGDKFPAEALRTRMGHRAMPAATLGQYTSLLAARKRDEKRIAHLKMIVDAKRSVLSALKLELEAAR